MKRSYPNSFGGQWQNKGYELIQELKLLENARRIGEEAVALHKAEQCPEGEFDIILDSSQLGLQIHESVGHPIELDRVLGMEANFAGTSFLTLDKLRKLHYGSDMVNVVADARQEHGPGLGTFGLRRRRRAGAVHADHHQWSVHRISQFAGDRPHDRRRALRRHAARRRLESPADDPHDQHQHSSRRETADAGSTDCVTDHGIYFETNRSWSIDDKRYNFQFGCEIGWEIKRWQAHTNAQESFVLGHHDRVLEFDGRDLLARSMDACGARPIAARDSRNR